MFPEGANVRGGQNAAVTHARAAQDYYKAILPVVAELRDRGLSLRKIAKELEARGFTPRYGYSSRWAASQIRRLLARAATTTAAEGVPQAVKS